MDKKEILIFKVIQKNAGEKDLSIIVNQKISNLIKKDLRKR